MKAKKCVSLLMVCIFALGCLIAPVGAAEDCGTDARAIIRATGQFKEPISAKSFLLLGDEISLDVNETISYNCTYTPKSASIDFGFIAPDGFFYSVNSTTGSINKTFKVSQRGSYTLAIYNNSDQTVTVTGTVNY